MGPIIESMTIKQAMASADPLPLLEVRMLLEYVLDKPRTWLIAHDDQMLTEQQVQVFYILVARRSAGVPMAYLLGTKEFMGRVFCVSPHVLIPRPDTETLVQQVVSQMPRQPGCRVVDLGTGSGAIAISLALARPDAFVVATDISSQALEVARLNAQSLGARVTFVQGSWFEAFPNVPILPGSLDIIVSNPPYIAQGDQHLSQGDLRFEPPGALTDGADGLSAYRIIVSQAAYWLKPTGQVWLEHGYDQAHAVQALFETNGFKNVQTLYDLGNQPRVTGGSL